jgi:hypothetical protein
MYTGHLFTASCPLSAASFYLASTNGTLVQNRKLLDQLAGRAQLADLLRDLFDRLHKFASFSRRDPGEMKAARFYTHIFNQIFKESEFSSGIIITFQVMAVSRVSPRDPDSISTLAKSCQEKLGVHPAGARHPDGSYVWGILQSAHPGKICGTVRAPIAEEGDYLWLPLAVSAICHRFSLERMCDVRCGIWD